LDVLALTTSMQSHLLLLGCFDRVNNHEPKSAPASGVTASTWFDGQSPARGRSGLASTTARVDWRTRLYKNMLSDPQDDIDVELVKALDLVMGSYSGDFTLGGLIAYIDLLGETGDPLRSRAGNVNQDGTLFRVIDLFVPMIVNDLWTQAP
jgi:hypothetical protein